MNSQAQRRLLRLTQIFLLSLACAPAVLSQDPPGPQLTAPPPIKAISKDERAQLEQAKDPKTRLRLTLELADAHLSLAERYTTQGSL